MTVRWGFLGAGAIATHAMAPALRRASGGVLQASAARDLDRARALAPAGRAYDDYEALLADPHVDAVYISLDNAGHRSWVERALRAGKHVLAEKPLALSAGDAAAMAATAERADRLLVEAMWWRWHPRVMAAARLLRDGAIGRVVHVRAGFSFEGGGGWRLDPAHGGGALYDVGCYALSAALWVMGTEPHEVAATAVRRSPLGVDTVAEVSMAWDDGATADVRCGIDEPYAEWLRITGTDGELELRPPVFTARENGPAWLWRSHDRQTERWAFPAVPTYTLMFDGFAARLTGQPDAFVVPLDDSLGVARVIDRALASMGSGP